MSDTPTALWGIRRTARELVDGTIRVQIDIDPKNRKTFNELLGEIDMPVALAPLAPEAVQTQEFAANERKSEMPRERTLAQQLHIDGYFRNPKLWRALHDYGVYTVHDHKQWVSSQDCIVRGAISPCRGDVVLHHCTSAAIQAAGAQLQPDAPNKVPHWYGVPLCHEHHRNWLHQGIAKREDKDRLLTEAVAIMSHQAKHAMKTHMGLDSLANITQDELEMFEEEIGLR